MNYKNADWIYRTMSYFLDSLSIDCDKFDGQLTTPKVVAAAGPYSDTKSPYIVTIRGICDMDPHMTNLE